MNTRKILAFFFIYSALLGAGFSYRSNERIFNLADLNGKNGFAINGIHQGDNSGYTVAGSGDVNGDGLNDILINALGSNNTRGAVYVVFGSKEEWPASIDLSKLNGANGFVINGVQEQNFVGTGISILGDVNGDGIDDILFGAVNYQTQIFQTCVIFGSKKNWPAAINYEEYINGENGFILEGVEENGRYQDYSLASAGDINGDGLIDLLMGSPGTGIGYVVFGRKNWSAKMNLSDFLDGIHGFSIEGIIKKVFLGEAVSGVGDINNDNIDDILISAYGIYNHTGQVYAIYGKKQDWPSMINVQNLTNSEGFVINGIEKGDNLGYSLSGVGDINGDGLDDILLGASRTPYSAIAQSYILYGRETDWPSKIFLKDLNINEGIIINGTKGEDHAYALSGIGDFNGDNLSDIIIGAPWINDYAGRSYVIYGKEKRSSLIINLSNLSDTEGFVIQSIAEEDNLGCSVSEIGDINGDGQADLLIGAYGVHNNAGQSYVLFGN